MSGSAIDLETHRAIEALLTEFAYRVDHGQADRVHELFVADAVLSTPAFTLNGRDEIEARFGARAKDTSRKSQHYCTNLRLSREGETIVAESNALTVIVTDGAAPFMMSGTSRDECVRHDGAWVFRRRALSTIFEGDLSVEPHP
jgi:ketosteroid isomerase-like protein